MSSVWKTWEIRDKPRGRVRREVTVESNDSVNHGNRYILICDPSLDGSDWLSLTLSQARALLAILPEAIATADPDGVHREALDAYERLNPTHVSRPEYEAESSAWRSGYVAALARSSDPDSSEREEQPNMRLTKAQSEALIDDLGLSDLNSGDASEG